MSKELVRYADAYSQYGVTVFQGQQQIVNVQNDAFIYLLTWQLAQISTEDSFFFSSQQWKVHATS